MTIQDIATDAAAIKDALQKAHDLADQALAKLKAAKLPDTGLNLSWLTTMRGCAATALNHANLHVQSVTAKASPQTEEQSAGIPVVLPPPPPGITKPSAGGSPPPPPGK